MNEITLEDILIYYHSRLAVGHTYTMINGAKNNSQSIIMVSCERQAQIISSHYKIPKNQFVNMHNKESLKGRLNPLVIDHFALCLLIENFREKYIEKIVILQDENRELKNKIKNREENLLGQKRIERTYPERIYRFVRRYFGGKQ